MSNAWKVSVFGVFPVRIFSHSDWILGYFLSLRIQSKCGKVQTRKTPNPGTFHAVISSPFLRILVTDIEKLGNLDVRMRFWFQVFPDISELRILNFKNQQKLNCNQSFFGFCSKIGFSVQWFLIKNFRSLHKIFGSTKSQNSIFILVVGGISQHLLQNSL